MQPVDAAFTSPELGAWLRGARERKGLAEVDLAHYLRIPVASVQALERGDFAVVGAPVYVRGFIRSFVKCVDAPVEGLEPLLQQLLAETVAELKPSHGPRVRGRSIGDRYAWAFSYAVGTALVLPFVWMLMRPSQPVLEPERAPTSVAADARGESSEAPARASEQVFSAGLEAKQFPSVMPRQPDLPVASNNPPVLASMSPFVSHGSASSGTLPQAIPTDSFELVMQESSWLEMTDGSGKRLVFDVVKPGRHRYSGTSPITLRAGNANHVQLVSNGVEQGLGDFAKANVARVKLSLVDGRWVAESLSGR